MKIDNNEMGNYNLKNFIKLFDRQESGNNTPIKGDGESRANPSEIINLFNRLDNQLQQKIIQAWLDLNLPLEIKHLKRLIRILSNKSIGSINLNHPEGSGAYKNRQLPLIRAFAFLVKKGLPLSAKLIESIAGRLTESRALSTELNRYTTGPHNKIIAPTTGNHSPDRTFVRLLSSLVIRPDFPPEELADILKHYQPSRILLELSRQDSSPEKVIQQLLGQRLLNLGENNYLLTLELPLFLPEEDKIVPGYLQIGKDDQKPAGDNSKKESYTISFIIKLDRLGTVRADIIYSQGSIQGRFRSDNPATCRLIERQISGLKRRLEESGLTIQKVEISSLKSGEVDRFLEGLLPTVNNSVSKDGITHIDLKA